MWANPRETVDLVTFTEEILSKNFIFFAVSPNKIGLVLLLLSKK